MNSSLPKVLQELSGKPILQWVIDSISCAKPEHVVIVLGHKADMVEAWLKAKGVKADVVCQKEQLGSANAVEAARDYFKDYTGDILVLNGDTPLIRPDTLKLLAAQNTSSACSATVLTASASNPFGYGRIIRKGAEFEKIVEQKDASPDELLIDEINAGVYCFDKNLWQALKEVKPNNAKGEYYITDTIAILRAMGKSVGIVKVDDEHEVMGINDRVQLAEACQIINSQTLKNLMKAGVSIMDPQNTYISYDAKIGRDTVIYPNCFIGPNVIIGANCRIEGATSIKNSTIGDNVIIKYSYIDGADISNNVNIGPYSHIRPESVLAENVKVGNFSEIKKSVIETGSKVNHLSYIGDAKVGKNVNVGAGTITCNYDGSKKHQTIIGDNSFVGSNVNLVAPVKIGEQVLIAAGSTITDDVEDKKLVIARSKQLTKVRNS